MQPDRIPIGRINPAPYNPRKDLKPSDPEYQKLVNSIDKWGLVKPLVWNRRTGHLVGGHQRFKVLVARGDTEVDVSVVDLDETQEKALNLALNKITGDWDDAKLAELLAELVDQSPDALNLSGFGQDEVTELLAGLELPELDTRAVDASSEGPAITRPGELIELGKGGEHRLLCGDVTDAKSLARLLGDDRASLIHTDPPYGVRYDPKNRPQPRRAARLTKGADRQPAAPEQAWQGIRNDDLTPKQYARWFAKVVLAMREALVPGGAFYAWNAHRYFGLMHDLLTEHGFKVSATLVWAKESFSPGFGDFNEQVEFCLYGFKGGARHRWYGPKNASTLWQVHRDRTRDYAHPTQKPLELAERAIRFSSRPGEVVFDPFLGSGTTLIAAARHRRRCLGLEIEPRHCDTVVRRYIALAGESAVAPEVAARYRLVPRKGVA